MKMRKLAVCKSGLARLLRGPGLWAWTIALIFSTLVFSTLLPAWAAEVIVKPGDNIQAMVQKSPPRTTFRFRPGTYRLQSILPREGDSFIGEPGAILSGAQLVTGFKRQGRFWVANVHAERSEKKGECAEDSPGCLLPEDLFIEDQPLHHHPNLEEVTPGKWHMDYDNDQLYMADDPTGRKVEISLSRHAFYGAVKNVTVKGLIVEKYANTAQAGAIQCGADPAPLGDGWVLEDNEIRFNHGTGIRLCHNIRVLQNNIHDNGQMGIAGSGRNILVEGNEIAHNNYAGYQFAWEAGGTKFVFTEGLIVRNNYSHDNNGPGLWTDIDNVNALYENNRTRNNKGAGIFHEISFDAVIRNNTLEEDGYNPHGNGPWWGAGIRISASSNVEVYGNTVTNCMNGIVLMQPKRGSSKQKGVPYVLRNVSVHDNVITQRDNLAVAVVADQSFGNSTFSNNIHFSHNTYRLADPRGKYFEWMHTRRNQNDWRSLGQD